MEAVVSGPELVEMIFAYMPMEAVLSSPELVDMIFAYMPRKTNAVTALVCKQWLEISRDHIWFEVENPKELLALLSPLGTHEGTGEPAFLRVPDEADWERFKPYACRVRRLSCDHPEKFSAHMSEALLHSRFRPNPLLPTLHSFGWDFAGQDPEGAYRLGLSLLFLHSGIRTLGLYNIPAEWVNWRMYDLRRFMIDIAHLSPRITTVDIRPDSPTQETDVIELVTRLTSLECAGLSQTLLTTPVMQALSRLPHMRKIYSRLDPDFIWQYDAPFEPHLPVCYTLPALENGAFQSLQGIHLCLSIQDATRMLSDQYFPSAQLQDLRLRTVVYAPNADLRVFLTAFVSYCPNVTSLILILYPPNHKDHEATELIVENLNLETIEPLRRATQLQHLIIHHITPVSLSESDLLHFIGPLQQLHTFYLVPRPDWDHAGQEPCLTSFGWRTISAVINNLPHLTDLGLYCNLSPIPDNEDPPTRGIDHLTLGTTAVPTSMSVHALAYRLSLLLNMSGVLRTDASPPGRWGVPAPSYSNQTELRANLAPWKNIRKLVYLSLSARSGVYRSELDKETEE